MPKKKSQRQRRKKKEERERRGRESVGIAAAAAAPPAPAAPAMSSAGPDTPARVILIPEIHRDLLSASRQQLVGPHQTMVSAIMKTQAMRGQKRFCFVSEGDGVHPAFQVALSDRASVPDGIREYAVNNFIVENVNKGHTRILSKNGSKAEIKTTLPTSPNILVTFTSSFFQDLGVLVYQLRKTELYPNTADGLVRYMRINYGFADFEQNYSNNIQFLINALQQMKGDTSLVTTSEGQGAIVELEKNLEEMKAKGLAGFYGTDGANYMNSIENLATMLGHVKILIKDSTDKSFNEDSKQQLQTSIDAIISGLKSRNIGDFNFWKMLWLGTKPGEIGIMMQAMFHARDRNIVDAMSHRMREPNPPQMFFIIFGAAHFHGMAAKISEAELLELEPASNKLYEKVMKIKKGGRKKTRRYKRKKTRKKKIRTKRRRKSRRKSRR